MSAPTTTIEITEIHTSDLPARQGETGVEYFARLVEVMTCGSWFMRARAAGRPRHELDAIAQTYFELTTP